MHSPETITEPRNRSNQTYIPSTPSVYQILDVQSKTTILFIMDIPTSPCNNVNCALAKFPSRCNYKHSRYHRVLLINESTDGGSVNYRHRWLALRVFCETVTSIRHDRLPRLSIDRSTLCSLTPAHRTMETFYVSE